MQNFGVTLKEHYGMLWYFLEWSITCIVTICRTECLLFLLFEWPSMEANEPLPPARKPYRIGVFTYKNLDFGAISERDSGMAIPEAWLPTP